MTSSDDETDDVLQLVSNYNFVDEKDEPISFSVLPCQWPENDAETRTELQVFLYGTADNGLQKVYKQVKAWKFDLTAQSPVISVLTKDNHWVNLQKARKSFEETIRSIMVTVHCLHYLKRNPEASGKTLWDYLGKTFSLYEVRPSQNDLVDEMELIGEAVKRDNSLAKCQFLLNFLRDKPKKGVHHEEDVQASTMSKFIVDDVIDDYASESDEQEDGLFDTVCTFCDNGGELLCCEGRCMRSFHATVEDGEESHCESLGFTKKEVKAMQNFLCKNCLYNQHQCFACGKLGSSDKSDGAEVIQCANGTCGYYYHPHCVAKLILPEETAGAMELEKKIAAGESFTCSIHKCCICKQVENKRDPDLQFAVCRRCPTAYHRKCLPSEIRTDEEVEGDAIARAWENLLPNRLLIYCLKHVVDDEIETPIRNHVIFPGVEENKEKKKRNIPESATDEGKASSKKRLQVSENSFWGNVSKDLHPAAKNAKRGTVTPKVVKMSSGPGSMSKVRGNDTSMKSSKENRKSGLAKMRRSATGSGNKASLGDRLFDYMKSPQQEKLGKQDVPSKEVNKTVAFKAVAEKLNSEVLDPDSERRLLALIKDANSSVNMEDVQKEKEVPSTHASSSKMAEIKSITLGKVEGAVEAVRTALKKLDDGCSIEDAKAFCEPEVLYQVFRWKNKLKVYLAPFLNGMRYTSFGRHFTKIEKLQEIVDMLHLYVQDGDMVVDFCCGANDFSCLMKKKLEETGKKCSYKNYDLFQPKNDFNFEKRDWLTVRSEELKKSGSQLVMGLNPPFGVKAALANKFIDKALEFRPKLLILIVPPETERLDKKRSPYDLVWEDDQFCSGKSFYLPGSIDENDKQIDQWNMIAPPLYLWSRHDWSAEHKAIAQKHGHPSKQREGINLENNHHEKDIYGQMVKDHSHNVSAPVLAESIHTQNMEPERLICGKIVDGGDKVNLTHTEKDGESQDSHHSRKSQPSDALEKRRQGEQRLGQSLGENSPNRRGSSVEKSPDDRWNRGKPLANEMHRGISHQSPASVGDGRSYVEGTSRSLAMPLQAEARPQSEVGISDASMHSGTSFGRNRDIHDDMDWRYTRSYEQYSHGFHRVPNSSNLVEQPRDRLRHTAESMTYSSHVPEPAREYDGQSQFHSGGHVDPYWQDPNFQLHAPYRFGPSHAHGQLGSVAASPYGTHASVMQRYVPQLDELNHRIRCNLGSEPPMRNGNSIYGPRPPARPPVYPAGFPPGFAPAAHHPQNSGRWFNE